MSRLVDSELLERPSGHAEPACLNRILVAHCHHVALWMASGERFDGRRDSSCELIERLGCEIQIPRLLEITLELSGPFGWEIIPGDPRPAVGEFPFGEIGMHPDRDRCCAGNRLRGLESPLQRRAPHGHDGTRREIGGGLACLRVAEVAQAEAGEPRIDEMIRVVNLAVSDQMQHRRHDRRRYCVGLMPPWIAAP